MPVVGAHGRGGHKDLPGRLEVFDFSDAEEPRRWSTRSTTSSSPTITRRSCCATGKRLRAIRADRMPDPRERAPQIGDEPSRKSGWIDLGRVRAVGRSARANGGRCCTKCGGCSATSSGCRTCRASTGRRSTRATSRCSSASSTRSELSDLIWEMQGELGTSHAYEMGGDYRKPPPMALGHLAAELRLGDRRRRATRSRASSKATHGTPAADSPLNAIGVQAQVGERIVAVNGQSVSRERPPQALLVHQANAKVELALALANATSAAGRGRRARHIANGTSGTATRTSSSRRLPTKCRRAIANGSSAIARGCTIRRRGASATCTCPT